MVIVVIVILLALLIHGCESSAAQDSLKTYNADVNNLITASDSNGADMFGKLGSGGLTTNNVQTRQQQMSDAAANARKHLQEARNLSVPSAMSNAQSSLVQVMRLREMGISEIARNVQSAASTNTSADAVHNMATATSLLYGSDIIYKTFVTQEIARALRASGIRVGTGPGAQQINAGQILPNLGWLQSSFIAQTIGAHESTAQANVNNNAPGNHGHMLNYVSVNGTQLSTTTTNTVPARPAPTFVLNFTNDGNFKEYQVGCTVTVHGLSDTGTATIAETLPGQTYNCRVTLPSAPVPHTFKVTTTIAGVPGENDFQNNTATYTVSFN